MRRYIVGFLATIGALVFLIVLGGLGVWIWSATHRTRIADNTVVSIDLSTAPQDGPRERGLTRLLFTASPSLADVLGTIEKAGDDPHISGLLLRIGDSNIGVAEIQELRDAIAAFRAKGKRAVAYADTFGELGSGTRSYYLAAACNEIWLQPMGMVGLVGLGVEMPYLRGTLDLLGVTPDFVHREEFKNAANMATETGMTAPEREEMTALLNSLYGQIQSGIAANRKIAPDEVKSIVDRAPLLTDEALKSRLVDHVGGRDEAASSFGPTAKFVGLSTYLDTVGPPHRQGPTIALIYASGLISRGGSDDNPLTGAAGSGADDLTRAFRLATEDKSVRAILFRINRPGGSAVAAETIWAAVHRAHEAGKPVIVSMGDVAGSGGYYIAAPADKIVAEPATLTGSIGVVAGKLVFGGVLKKVGATWGSITVGANAGMFSLFDEFSDSQRVRLDAVIDDIYAGFKRRVAEGRKLDAEAVEAAAKGRVWSGEDARGKGLVDQLGGMKTALDLAKATAGIPADQDVDLKPYPPPRRGFIAAVSRLIGGGGVDALMPQGSLAFLRGTLQGLALLLAPPGSLTMSPVAPR